MTLRNALKEITNIVNRASKSDGTINIKIHFNSGDVQVTSSVEATEFLTRIGHSADCPLSPYLDKFISTFKNIPKGEKKCTKS